MAEREQKRKPAPQRRDVEVEEDEGAPASGDQIKSDLDSLIDEIDGVLEENAEEFVKAFIQKGGE